MTPAKKTTPSSVTDGEVDVAAADHEQLPEDIARLSYEEARDQLVEVVRRLEAGQGGLEESIGQWERGEMLATRCQQWLDGARERLDDAVAARGKQRADS
ncbi:MAG: exodeoxyribonuclease VII small subunit [Brachybacterium sp.]|nr:exodeoxyribonuclease VII small subunit [Brachybacterium sp.]